MSLSVANKTRSGGVFKAYFDGLVGSGMKRELATITLARKIAATTLAVWKKGEPFDPKKLKTTSTDSRA